MPKVSILVLLDVVLQVDTVCVVVPEALVSILVLLDVVLQVIARKSGCSQPNSFNPCSIGCCSSRPQETLLNAIGKSFNPCSIGCCSSSKGAFIDNNLIIWFQSLFYWMLFFKKTQIPPWRDWTKFQSLFYWMLFFKMDEEVNRLVSEGFNPCSIGCCSSRNGRTIITGRFKKFQSLFYWMLFFKLQGRHDAGKSQRVSILVLLDVVLQGRYHMSIACVPSVSILVLLDVVLQVVYFCAS